MSTIMLLSVSFYISTSDNESFQVFRTLLSILVDFNGALIDVDPSGLSFFFQDFGDGSMYSCHNWYHRHFHVPQLFQLFS